MAIRATKLTALLLSGAMVAGGALPAFAATEPANGAATTGENAAVTAPADQTATTPADQGAATDPATPAKVDTSKLSAKELKVITDQMFNDMTLEQIKAYVDANNSKELVAGMVGEVYVHPKDTPEEQAAQKVKLDKMADATRYAYDKLSRDDQANLPEIPEGYEYPGAAGADYFSTAAPIGKADKDKAQNERLTKVPTKKKEVLVVSFGTSFNSSRYQTIGAIERAIEKKYSKGYSVRRAFTSQVIIDHIRTRDGYWIDTVREAMQKAKDAGVTELTVQPTTLMAGEEYKLMQENVKNNSWKGLKVKFGQPLLSTSNASRKTVGKAIAKDAVKVAKQKQSTLKKGKKIAYVFMGHGTSDVDRATYTRMQTTFSKDLKYNNVFVGTVEGKPSSTSLKNTIKKVKKGGYKKVVLRPLMVVAGDHANNDMAGKTDPESWYSGFRAAGWKAKNIQCQIKGLGQLKTVQNIYVANVKKAK